MSGRQAIIDKIISEAEAKAAVIVEDAQKQAQALIAEAAKDNARLNDLLLDRARSEAMDTIASSLREGELKIRLKNTAMLYAAIEDAFSRARQRLFSLSDDQYLDYIKKHIMRFASDGDGVIVSSLDKHRIDARFIAGIAKELGISLSLIGESGDFEGGVVLRSKFWDTNLAIDSNFGIFREEFEPKVSKMLSGEK